MSCCRERFFFFFVFALSLSSVLAFGCGEDAAPRDERPLDGGYLDAIDDGGDTDPNAPDAGDTGDVVPDASDTGDTGDTGETGDADSARQMQVCVLDGESPDAPCADQNMMGFGSLDAGSSATRMFRLTNAGDETVEFTHTDADAATWDIEVLAVRYEADPDDASSFIRIEEQLPLDRGPGESLYFEVTLTPNPTRGELADSSVRVLVDEGAEALTSYTIPLAGELAGCPESLADCDGDPANGCEVDLTSSGEHCGACNNNCALDHTQTTCSESMCELVGCQTDWFDRDGDPSNGCEFHCPTGSLTDVPDDNFDDENCDGIDGNAANAIFVAPSGDDADAGTMAAPKGTLQAAIDAASQGMHVYIAAGTYRPSATIELANGVSLYGGYDETDWSRAADNEVRIESSATTVAHATGVVAPTTIDRVVMIAADATAPTVSSYGLLAQESNGLVITHSHFEAGNGGHGTDGGAPSGTADDGSPGQRGDDGRENDPGFMCAQNPVPSGALAGSNAACPAADGGNGGDAGTGAQSGGDGQASAAGTVGGPGVPAMTQWSSPGIYDGADGANGLAGTDGAAGVGSYERIGYRAEPGENGAYGAPGAGGGGGGGGGGGTASCESTGGAGGGGGAGGCGGASGGGGSGGGGSFAIYLYASDVSISDCTLVTGDGGSGGNGGTGQPGGTGAVGGLGGSSEDDSSRGGKGGDGGDGGRGGHGGAGAGGPSVGIVYVNSSPALSGNTYQLGAGGAGGTSAGNDGPAGPSANTYTP